MQCNTNHLRLSSSGRCDGSAGHIMLNTRLSCWFRVAWTPRYHHVWSDWTLRHAALSNSNNVMQPPIQAQWCKIFPIYPRSFSDEHIVKSRRTVITSHVISCLILFSLLIMNFIQQKLSFFHLTIIVSKIGNLLKANNSDKISAFSKLPVFVYSIFPLPLTPLIMLSSCISCLCGLKFMPLYLTGSKPTFQIVYSASRVHTISEPYESCYGIPQGSVLGPLRLLFTFYTTSLSSLISSF